MADLQATIRRVANFLWVTLGEQQVRRLDAHLKFERFKTNKSVNLDFAYELNLFEKGEEGFIRKGKVGGWRDYFEQQQAEEAVEWLKENQKAIGILFKY